MQLTDVSAILKAIVSRRIFSLFVRLYTLVEEEDKKKQNCFLIVLKSLSKKRKETIQNPRQRNPEANDLRENLPLAVENRRSPLYCRTANVKTQFAVNFNLIISLVCN